MRPCGNLVSLLFPSYKPRDKTKPNQNMVRKVSQSNRKNEIFLRHAHPKLDEMPIILQTGQFNESIVIHTQILQIHKRFGADIREIVQKIA